MFARIREFLAPPVFEDEEKTRVAALLNTILLATFAIAALFTIVLITSADVTLPIIGAASSLLALALWFVMRRGRVRLAGVLFTVINLASVTGAVYSFGDAQAPIAFGYIICIVAAGILIDNRAALAFTAASVLLLLGLSQAETSGLLPPTRELGNVEFLTGILGIFGITAVLIGMASRSITAALARTRRSERDLAERNRELAERTQDLTERARELRLTADLSQRLATMRDLDLLLAQSVELIRESFDLYYVQIYLADSAGRNLALRAGTGEAGAALVRRGHALPIGPGSINGVAAATKKATVVPDTFKSATFLPNPLLPDTRSEMAVPLVVGEQVVGVLNLQDDQPGSLTDAALPVFETLAGQLAIAVDNANLFTEATQARAEVEAQLKRLAHTGWQDFMDGIRRSERVGYTYEGDALVPIVEPLAMVPAPHVLAAPIQIQQAPVGAIRIEGEDDRAWTEAETELVTSIANQVAQQVENLRLLAQADQYRAEAEQATRLLTREGWQEYLAARAESSAGFIYDRYEVKPLTAEVSPTSVGDEPVLTQPLQIHGEPIGQLALREVATLDDEAVELTTAVAERLSTHIESLRLFEETRTRQHELEERSQELEASQRVTFAAAETTDPSKLLDMVVNLIRDQFGLYHVQVYLVDEKNQAAVLYKSTGYAGGQLLEKGHQIPLSQPSLITMAIHEGEPVVRNDVSKDKNWLPNPLLPHTSSELVLPLKAGSRIVGALDVQSRSRDFFSPRIVALFQTMAEQVAMNFQTTDLLERTTEQAESLTRFATQLRTVAEIARRMGTILDPERLLEQIVEMLQSRFGLYHAHIYVVDETTNHLRMHAGSGEVGRVLRKQGHAIPLNAEKSPVARAVRSKQTVLVNDTSLESDFMPNPLLPQTRSEVALPLVSGEKVLGVLDIQDDQPDRFSETDIDTFGTLAGQIATALQTASVFAQTQLRLQVSQALTNAQTEEQVLDVLIQQAGLYPQGAVVIQSIDPEARELTMVSRRGAAFDSGLEIPPDGSRLTTSDFPLLQHVSSDTPFVTSNLLHDERIDPKARELLSQMGLVSFAALPITAGTEWLGIVAVSSKEEGFFDERKLNLYHTLVEQGATALQIARLNDATEQERNFSDTVINSLPTTFFMFDTQGNLIRWNNKFLEMSGLSPKELKDIQVTDLVVEEDQATVMETIQKVFAEGQAEVEARGLSKDKGSVPYHFTAARAIVDNQAYLVGAGLDITERKRAEEERERFTNQLRTAADLAEQVNAILDPDQLLPEVVNELQNRFGLYHVHVYTLSEPTAEQLISADAAEVARLMRERPLTLRAGSGEPGQKLLERGHTIALHIEKSLVARAARDRRPVLVNDTTKDPDFMPNPLLPETRSEVAIPLVAGENVLGVLDVQDSRPDRFTQSDVDVLVTLAGQIATTLQNASYFEEVQRTAEQLREVDRLKSEFLASMSHELRTPLNSIIGYTEIMLMGLDTDLSPETLEDVQAIYDNGQHLLRIINDVLDLAKIEAGRLELNKEEVPVEVLVDAASSSVTGLLVNKEKLVKFNVEVEKGLPTIYGDQVRLNQVINNLASNAVKFTDEGHITMRAFRDDGWICLEVEDTGTGIAEQDQDKIFERFQQVDGSNARKQEGTGLGLAITRHLVQMHGGTIKVKSKLGKGSTFTVRLPIVENSTQNATPEAPQEAPAPKKKAAAKPKSSKKKKSTKAPASSEAGVELSSSDIVDILLE
jgi:PAS domain S-box-containing protein